MFCLFISETTGKIGETTVRQIGISTYEWRDVVDNNKRVVPGTYFYIYWTIIISIFVPVLVQKVKYNCHNKCKSKFPDHRHYQLESLYTSTWSPYTLVVGGYIHYTSILRSHTLVS